MPCATTGSGSPPFRPPHVEDSPETRGLWWVSAEGRTVTGMRSAGEPMIEGERASLVLAAVLNLRIRSKHDGTVLLAGSADARAMAALVRAVDRLGIRMRSLSPAELVDPANGYAERRAEAFTIVVQRAMGAYGMTVAPWQYQLSEAS